MTGLRRTMLLLRYDALDRGMTDLAVVYGWSALSIGNEMLENHIAFNDPPRTSPTHR